MIVLCSIENCCKPVRSKGWCEAHYHRWYRHGDPLGFSGTGRYSTPEDAFRARTVWQGDCLVWTGSSAPRGYGQLFVDGRLTPAHRYAWQKANGKIPDGMFLDHACHNPPCCNVDHLRLATPRQNAWNRGVTNNATGYRGVFFDKRRGTYYAQVTKDGRTRSLSPFDSAEDASRAAESLRVELFGEFAGAS